MAKRASRGLTSSTAIVETTLIETPSTGLTLTTIEDTTTGGTTTPTEDTTPERVSLTILAINGARKEGKETIIHSSLWGKERWFAKKRLHSYTNLGNGSYFIVIPTTELGYRDSELTEPLAGTTPFEGFGEEGIPNTFHKGGAYEILNAGY